jgi:hypothetical protein
MKIKKQKITAQSNIPYIGETAIIVAIASPKIAECEIASEKYAIFFHRINTPIGAVAIATPIPAIRALMNNGSSILTVF